MKLWVVAALVAVAACGNGKSRTYEFKTSLKTNSGKQSGLPDERFASYEDGTPALAVTGSATPLVDAMRIELEKNKLVKLGNVKVELVLPAAMPKLPDGKTGLELTMTAVYVAAPEVIKLDATITGDIAYSGATVELFARYLAQELIKHLEKQKLPANIGPMPKAAGIKAITVGPPDCTLHDDKTIRCWDRDVPVPTVVPKATPTIVVDSGNNYGVCGVRENGRVYCIDAWDNTVAMEVRDVCGIEGAVSVSVGQQSACALLGDGTVKCWGPRPEWFEPCGKREAVAVKGVTEAAFLHTGPHESCVVTKAGNVQCWQLCGKGCKSGIVGEVDTHADTAVAVKGISKVTLVHAYFNVCGVNGNKVTCVDKTTKKPWSVTLPEPVTQLGNTTDTLCGLTTSNKIVCWPLYIDGKDKPAEVMSDVTTFDAYITGLCAAMKSGDVKCWGGMDNTPPDKAKTVKL